MLRYKKNLFVILVDFLFLEFVILVDFLFPEFKVSFANSIDLKIEHNSKFV